MKIMSRRAGLFLALFLVPALVASCAFGAQLRTEAVAPGEVSGTVRLYLYGCRYPHDIENFALLVDERTPEQFDLFVPATAYKVREHLPAAEALRQAEAFFRCSVNDLGRTVLRRVKDSSGRTLAYEMKPLYDWMTFGKDEVLVSTYSRKGNKVTVYLEIDPRVERARRDIPAASPDH